MNYIQKIIYNLSIDKKLLLLSMLTSILAVVLSCSAFITFILYEERRDLINEMIHVGDIIHSELTNSLAIKNHALMNHYLRAITVRDAIVQACVYDRSGNAIAQANSEKNLINCSNVPKIHKRYDFINIKDKFLFVRTELKDRGVKIGSLYTISSLDLISNKIIRSLYNAIFVLVVILALCYKVSKNLQKNVSEPILHLASVSYSVKSGDYDIRAKYKSQDEIGELIESFNNMLNVIQDSKENLECKVIERTKQHEKALLAKTEFLSNMSHEIRTPIHGIMNYADFLVNDWQKLTEIRRFDFLTKIYNNSNRLLSLINNLLDLSKLEANKMDFCFLSSNLKEIIDDVLSEIEPLYINKKIKIIFENKCNDDVFVDLDKERISQVIRNLLSNAIKFTNQGEIIITLQPAILFNRTGEDNKAISLSVADNGIGVPEDELVYIFDKFNQSAKTKTGAGGTGLGLTISKDIIKAHKGKIWAENNVNNLGATFFFIIPLKQVQYDEVHFIEDAS